MSENPMRRYRPGIACVLVALLSACAAEASPSPSAGPSASAPGSSISRGECTLTAYPAVVEAGGESMFIGEGFRYGAEITLTLHKPGEGDAVFTSADAASLKVTYGLGFALALTAAVEDAGATIGLEATDARCVATASWTIAAPGDLPSPSPPVPTPCEDGRSTADRPDTVDGYQIHLVYALAADSADEESDVSGQLAQGVAYANDWLADQTDGARLRFDTCGSGLVDVSYARLPAKEAIYVGARDWWLHLMERDLSAAGFSDPRKIYAVWWGGKGPHCGGEAPSEPAPGAVVWLFARDLDGSPCHQLGSSPRSYANLDLLHEVIHALGMVAPCAPHSNATDPSHVTEAADLMNNDESAWDAINLDKNHDDYFGHDIAGCPDLADSAFIDPLPPNAVLPVGWEQAP